MQSMFHEFESAAKWKKEKSASIPRPTHTHTHSNQNCIQLRIARQPNWKASRSKRNAKVKSKNLNFTRILTIRFHVHSWKSDTVTGRRRDPCNCLELRFRFQIHNIFSFRLLVGLLVGLLAGWLFVLFCKHETRIRLQRKCILWLFIYMSVYGEEYIVLWLLAMTDKLVVIAYAFCSLSIPLHRSRHVHLLTETTLTRISLRLVVCAGESELGTCRRATCERKNERRSSLFENQISNRRDSKSSATIKCRSVSLPQSKIR